MKNLVVLAMVMTSAISMASTVYTYYAGYEKYPTTDHFYVSSFVKDLKHCYNGPTEGLCEEIKKGEQLTLDGYAQGAHDFFEIVSCSHDHDEYTVKTKLYDDYGTNGEELVSVFGQCD